MPTTETTTVQTTVAERETTIADRQTTEQQTTLVERQTTVADQQTTVGDQPTTADGQPTTEADQPTTAAEQYTTVADQTTSVAVLACNDTDTCSGHYTCDEFGRRVCNEHWSGDDCATRNYTGPGFDPECPEIFGIRRPCINGQCFDESCCCDPGYEGLLCETDINECDSSPCGGSRDAFCINQVNGYTCVCQDGTYNVLVPWTCTCISILNTCTCT